jgi:hypothetical protein
MTRMTETLSDEGVQYGALAVLSLGAAGATGILSLSQDTYFQPYFGSINPLLAVGLVTVLGGVALGFLHARGWFEIFTRREYLKGLVLSVTLATLFAIVMICVDLTLGFPRDLNVPPPQSLLFYPAVAYVAEIVFHALPLALLLVSLGPLFKQRNPKSLVWVCILLTAFLEPILQLGWGFKAYVGLHVFAFNLLQLYVFRRYDFVAMYALRLVYYIHWHIIWGYVRLHILF